MFPRGAVVILVLLLGTIATIALVAYVRVKPDVDIAKGERVATDSRFFRSQLEAYRRMHGSFPTTEQGLRALLEKPAGSPNPIQSLPPLEEIVPDDWGTPYIYRCPGIKHPNGYDLFSAGPDRKPDTADDVWRE